MYLNQLSIGLAHVKFCEGFPSCQCCQQVLYSWIGYLFNFDTWFTIIIKSQTVLSPFRTRTMGTAQSKCCTGSKMPSHTNRFNSCSTLALMTLGLDKHNKTEVLLHHECEYLPHILSTFPTALKTLSGDDTEHLVENYHALGEFSSNPARHTQVNYMAKQAHALSLQHKQGQAGSLLYCTSSLSIPRTPNGFPE